MPNKYERWIYVLALLAADQLLKVIAIYEAFPLDEYTTLVYNTGATFGIFPGSNHIMIGVSIVAMLIVGYVFMREEKEHAILFGTILAGITGNFIDRIQHGAVIDYIDLPFFDAVFNLADALIVTGVLGLLLIELLDWIQNSEKSSSSSK